VKRKYILEHYPLELSNPMQWSSPERGSEFIRHFVKGKEFGPVGVTSSYEDRFVSQPLCTMRE